MAKLGLILLAVVALAYAAAWIVGGILRLTKRTADATMAVGQESIANVRAALRYLFRKDISVSIDRGYRPFLRRLEDVEKAVVSLEKWQPARNATRLTTFSFTKSLPVFAPFHVPAIRGGSNKILLSDIPLIRTTRAADAGQRLREMANASCEFPLEEPPTLTFSVAEPPAVPPEITTEELQDAHYKWLASGGVRKRLLEKLFQDEILAVKTANKEIAYARERAQDVAARLSKARNEYGRGLEALRSSFEREIEGRRRAYEIARATYLQSCERQRSGFRCWLAGYKAGTQQGVTEYFGVIAAMIDLPGVVPNELVVGYDKNSQILIIEVRLNNLPDLRVMKRVRLKAGEVEKPANKSEAAQVLDELHLLQLLRIGHEVALADEDELLKSIVLNGWVEYAERSTGKTKRGYVAAIVATPSQLRELVLETVDPLAAFKSLRGLSAFVADDVVPIKPTIALDRNDPRFVEGREVLSSVGAETNLAAMEWEDFEHLIRQLFEKLFAGAGTEVHVTQASRDRGVDAIVLDPDPIRGGKTIIQAKRYANTVDVAAVRDLYGALMNEGASRGILVTTSNFGSDAYQFVKDKPLTLINGAGLLAYLKEMGFEARIDLEEAKRINALST